MRRLPHFLENHVDDKKYKHWLKRTAKAHVTRDRKRGYQNINADGYRKAIHEAVLASDGRDVYTGEGLDWHLISKYNNEESKAGRHHYKAKFALLPTVDHVESAVPDSGFCICAWRTNDAKNDLSHLEFIGICASVLRHAGFTVTKDAYPAG